MGGVAVVYRHAEGLVARGHDVTVAAPRSPGGVGGAVRSVAVWVRDRLHGVGLEPYHSAAGVRTVEPPTPGELDSSTYDAVIATGHQTAPWVASMTSAPARDRSDAPPGRGGAGVYLIQHDERHLSPAAEATWHLGLQNVTVAGWIADVVRDHGAPVLGVVPNAVDFGEFGHDVPLADRERRVVALYHRLPVKGPDVLVGALDRLRERVPDVGADVISARPPGHRLPGWVDLHVRPPRPALRAIYNRAAVCLHTARLEGWGLVPMEAAACGCAVVATASRGPAEFLRAGRSFVEVPVDDAGALAHAAADLLCRPARRAEIAEAGMADVARFSWSDSTDRLEAYLLEAVGS